MTKNTQDRAHFVNALIKIKVENAFDKQFPLIFRDVRLFECKINLPPLSLCHSRSLSLFSLSVFLFLLRFPLSTTGKYAPETADILTRKSMNSNLRSNRLDSCNFLQVNRSRRSCSRFFSILVAFSSI